MNSAQIQILLTHVLNVYVDQPSMLADMVQAAYLDARNRCDDNAGFQEIYKSLQDVLRILRDENICSGVIKWYEDRGVTL